MFDDYCLLGCDAMKSGKYVSMFQRDFLPPLPGQILGTQAEGFPETFF